MADAPQGPGWWRASDGRWYPPEAHPSAQHGQPPAPQPAVPALTDIAGRTTPGGRRIGGGLATLVALLAVVLVLGLVVLVVGQHAPSQSAPPIHLRGTRLPSTNPAAPPPTTQAPNSDGLAGRSPGQILSLMDSAVVKEGSVHYSSIGTFPAPEPNTTITGDVGADVGTQTIVQGQGVGTVVLVKSIVYTKGNASFLVSALGMPAATATTYAGTWLSTQPSDQAYPAASADLTLSSVLTFSTPGGLLSVAGPATIDGRSVIGVSGGLPAALTGPGSMGISTIYVSTTAPYLPVEVDQQGEGRPTSGNVKVTFSNWGERVAVVAPPASTPSASLVPATT